MTASRLKAGRSPHEVFDYRRLASTCADGETPRAVVVLHDERDGPIVAGLEVLRVLSAQGSLRPLLLACLTESGLEVSRVADGTTSAEDLFDALHRIGRIDRLDIVTVFSETLDEAVGGDLAETAADLARRSRHLAAEDTYVLDHRVSVSSYDSMGTAAFGGTPDARLVVIAEDRRYPSAMARPLDASDLETFGPHTAVEIASICGLWETMDGSALELIRATASGTGSQLVILARSFVRTARLMVPSPAEAMRRGESLPVPAGALRSPVPEAVTERAAELLHPEALRYRPDNRAPPDTVQGSRFWSGFFVRLRSDIRRFPSRLRDRGRSEVAAALDELAAVWHSETALLFASDAASSETDVADGPVRDRVLRPVEVFVPDVWNDLVQDILGVADYSEHARRIRQDASGDERHLLVSKRCLVSTPEEHLEDGDDPWSVYCKLGGVGAMQSQAGRYSLSTLGPDADEGDSTQDFEPPASADPAGDAASLQGDHGISSDVPRSRVIAEPSEHTAVRSGDGDLLRRLTVEFEKHKRRAVRALDECNQRIAQQGLQWHDQPRPDIEMSRAVPYLLAYGILLALWCWTILPGWGFLQTDIVDNSWWLSRVWVSVTVALALSLMVLNMPRETKRRQLYLIVGTAALLGTASWLLLADGPVRRLMEADADALATPLVVLLLALMAISVWLMIGRDGTTSALRLSAVLVLVYVTAIAVAVLNDNAFTEQIAFLNSGDYTLIVVLSVVAACLVLASFAVVSILHYRNTLELERRRDEMRELASWHHEARSEAERLASVLPHWLGTALALHRIIRLPYGASNERQDHLVGDGAGDLWEAAGGEPETEPRLSAPPDPPQQVTGVLSKSVFYVLEATDRGHETFRRLLQLDLARPGWLYAQYRRAAEAYRASLDAPGSAGLAGRGQPDACAYPYLAKDDLLNTVNGDRWPFVQRLYQGDFDPVLRERVEAFVAGGGLEELFDEIESFRIAFGTHPSEAPLGLLTEIAPAPDPEIPQGMLGGLALNVSREERHMQSYLWWPQRLAVPSDSVPHARSRSLQLGESVVHQAVRVDLSKPIHLASLTGPAAPSMSVADAGRSDRDRDNELPEPHF